MESFTRRAVARASAKVGKIDLSPIRLKLCTTSTGTDWCPQRVAEAEAAYRRFLTLNILVRRPARPLVPSEDADAFWHYHILDTRKYTRDCKQVFGHFLHHFPYLGLCGPADAQALTEAGEYTLALLAEAFPELTVASLAAKCSSCGRA